MDFESLLYTLPSIILGLVVHEFFHAWTAHKLGDPTPQSQGRLTLNPLKHIDPLGFLFLVVARFGWARPVECNTAAFKHPRLGMSLVALAGPFSNFVLAFLFAAPAMAVYSQLPLEASLAAPWMVTLLTFLDVAVRINLGLFLFNLIPLPPLDGSHLWMGLFPDEKAWLKQKIYSFGALSLFGLLILSQGLNLNVFSFLGEGVNAVAGLFYDFWDLII